jgi:GDPmannose 4,6-dehydratase
VIATGKSHSVQDFAENAFSGVGLDWHEFVVVDEALFRPAEVEELRGDASKIREELGWMPTVGFEQLVKTMVDEDVKLVHQTASEYG